jgi:hypothetical protein
MFQAAHRSSSGALSLQRLVYIRMWWPAVVKSECQHVYVGQTSRHLKQRYKEHIRYIRNNDPQSAFAQHILNNQHEYGTIEEIMKLLKPINHTSMLIPYELFFIQSHHQHGQLISKQNPGEINPLIQLGLDTVKTHVTTWSIITGTIPKPVPTQTSPQPSPHAVCALDFIYT